jgi:hypothetical protein
MGGAGVSGNTAFEPMNSNTVILLGVALACGVMIGIYLSNQEPPEPTWKTFTKAAISGTCSGLAASISAKALASI